MVWGAYVQGGNLEEIDKLGRQLSIEIDCPVHFPAYDKNLFECKCMIVFRFDQVKYAVTSGNWSIVKEIHSAK